MDEEAVNVSVDTEVASPASEEVTPDYNSPEYDETQEVAPVEEVADEAVADEQELDEGDDREVAPKETSPRFEKRIRQLSAKVKELSTPATQAPVIPQSPLNNSQSVGPRQLPPGDYSPEEINAFVAQESARTGQALASIEVQQLRAELAMKEEISSVQSTYSNELHSVESKYSELNEDSPEFDGELAQAVTEMYEDAFQADPKSASLLKIADRIMAINKRTATKSAVNAAKKVASQRSSSAPSSSTSGPTKSEGKWTAEAVAELSIDEYAANEAAIKRDLYGR